MKLQVKKKKAVIKHNILSNIKVKELIGNKFQLKYSLPI